MLNAPSLNAVNSSRFSQKFIKPLYESYCFANIPATILYLLTGEGHQHFEWWRPVARGSRGPVADRDRRSRSISAATSALALTR